MNVSWETGKWDDEKSDKYSPTKRIGWLSEYQAQMHKGKESR